MREAGEAGKEESCEEDLGCHWGGGSIVGRTGSLGKEEGIEGGSCWEAVGILLQGTNTGNPILF